MSELDTDQETPEPNFWTVAIYMVDRHYGGPEEGDWYYTAGTRVDTPLDVEVPPDMVSSDITPDLNSVVPRLFSGDNAENMACEWCDLVQAALDITLNRDRREISSVLSTGRYQAVVHAGWPPTHFPTEKPTYE